MKLRIIMRKPKKGIPNKFFVSFTETVRFSLRGYRVWWGENPKILLSVMVCGVVSALTPYVDIWLLARLINEIAGECDPHTLQCHLVNVLSSVMR